MMVHSAGNSLQRQLSAIIIADQNFENMEYNIPTARDQHDDGMVGHLIMTVDRVGSPKMEKQIFVDPISLKESFPILPPIKTNPKHNGPFHVVHVPPLLPSPPPLPPPRLAKHNNKLLSYSLPSSPRLMSALLLKNKKKNSKNNNNKCLDGASPSSQGFHQTKTRFQKSKSCGEGRASEPSVGFDDLLLLDCNSYKATNLNNVTNTDATAEVNTITMKEEQEGKMIWHDPSPNNYQQQQQQQRQKEEEFKCGGCLFLPGFGKGKPVKAKKVSSCGEDNDVNMIISRTVSLEKFECGSWASSAIEEKSCSDVMTNLYFDLPLELIRMKADGDDAYSPVTAAFIFDKDRKGLLKNGCGSTRKSTAQNSSCHVRFSVSSPRSYPASPSSSSSSCITPRLRKARDDFNAFLEAQSA